MLLSLLLTKIAPSDHRYPTYRLAEGGVHLLLLADTVPDPRPDPSPDPDADVVPPSSLPLLTTGSTLPSSTSDGLNPPFVEVYVRVREKVSER